VFTTPASTQNFSVWPRRSPFALPSSWAAFFFCRCCFTKESLFSKTPSPGTLFPACSADFAPPGPVEIHEFPELGMLALYPPVRIPDMRAALIPLHSRNVFKSTSFFCFPPNATWSRAPPVDPIGRISPLMHVIPFWLWFFLSVCNECPN